MRPGDAEEALAPAIGSCGSPGGGVARRRSRPSWRPPRRVEAEDDRRPADRRLRRRGWRDRGPSSRASRRTSRRSGIDVLSVRKAPYTFQRGSKRCCTPMPKLISDRYCAVSAIEIVSPPVCGVKDFAGMMVNSRHRREPLRRDVEPRCSSSGSRSRRRPRAGSGTWPRGSAGSSSRSARCRRPADDPLVDEGARRADIGAAEEIRAAASSRSSRPTSAPPCTARRTWRAAPRCNRRNRTPSAASAVCPTPFTTCALDGLRPGLAADRDEEARAEAPVLPPSPWL